MSKHPNLNRILLVTLFGNTLEWFDYAIFGYLMPVFAEIMFPQKEEFSAIFYILIIFALGNFARILGGISFGYLGDRWGRRVGLIASISSMIVPTSISIFLPSYLDIGIASAYLLSIARFLQGFSVGGEFPGIMTFLIEAAPISSRGYYGCYAFFGMFIGMFLGTANLFIITEVSSEAGFLQWGWRFPFAFATILGLIGLYLRKLLHETPVFLEMQSKQITTKTPLHITLKEYKKPILQVIGIGFLGTCAFHLVISFSTTYLTDVLSISIKEATGINLISIAVSLCFILIGGWLSMRTGLKRFALFASGAFLVLSYPIFFLMHHEYLPFQILGFSILSILLVFYMAPLPAIFCELFPTKVRYSGLGIGYNAVVSIIGGITPLVAYQIIEFTAEPVDPSYILIVAALISFLSLLTLQKQPDLSEKA